jgi:hypothetical protein
LLRGTLQELESRVRAIMDRSEPLGSAQLEIDQLVPRVKEGGAFVRFSSSSPIDPGLFRNQLLTKIDQLKSPWLVNAHPDIHLVQVSWTYHPAPSQPILIFFFFFFFFFFFDYVIGKAMVRSKPYWLDDLKVLDSPTNSLGIICFCQSRT